MITVKNDNNISFICMAIIMSIVFSSFHTGQIKCPKRFETVKMRLGSTDAVTCLRNSVAPLSLLVGWKSLHAD